MARSRNSFFCARIALGVARRGGLVIGGLVMGSLVMGSLITGSLAGCSAGGSSSDPTTSNGSNSGSNGGGGSSLIGDNGINFGDTATERVGCSQIEFGFEAQTPTALLVVDRSSSQWDNEPNHSWEPMKAGILSVVDKVQEDIRVGMVTYTGQNGGACPDLYPPMASISFDKNNLARIQTDINAVDEPDYKGETPTAVTLQQALPVLLADPSPGDKVMLLVTDGDPDFCNDPDRICAMDAVIGAVQEAYRQGVATTVFGLQRQELSEQHLRDVANAGAGLPVALPQGVNSEMQLRERCRNNPAGSLPGTYAAQGGNAQYFQANGTDTSALGEALNAVIYGIRSCVFDLAGAAEINPGLASLARITMDDGAPLVFNDPNGWTLRNATQVELLGAACQQLKLPTTGNIEFDFPCDSLIPR